MLVGYKTDLITNTQGEHSNCPLVCVFKTNKYQLYTSTHKQLEQVIGCPVFISCHLQRDANAKEVHLLQTQPLPVKQA